MIVKIRRNAVMNLFPENVLFFLHLMAAFVLEHDTMCLLQSEIRFCNGPMKS